MIIKKYRIIAISKSVSQLLNIRPSNFSCTRGHWVCCSHASSPGLKVGLHPGRVASLSQGRTEDNRELLLPYLSNSVEEIQLETWGYCVNGSLFAICCHQVAKYVNYSIEIAQEPIRPLHGRLLMNCACWGRGSEVMGRSVWKYGEVERVLLRQGRDRHKQN